LSCLEVSSPNIMTNPARMPIKLNKTCTDVNAVILRIMRGSFD
jgi:hypothetical protein